MGKVIDETGNQYGQWTVLRRAKDSNLAKHRKYEWCLTKNQVRDLTKRGFAKYISTLLPTKSFPSNKPNLKTY